MGKLVLAIAAVVLLQMAFFKYLAVSDPEFASGPVVKNRKFPREPQQVLVAQQPPAAEESSTATDVPAPEAGAISGNRSSARQKPAQFLARSRQSSQEPAKQRASALKPGTDTLNPTIIYVKSGQPYEERSVSRVKGERVTPRDYKMALAEAPVAATATQAKMAAPRKRSFLARTFVPLVRKPWNFMKSVASKLH